MLGKSPIRGQDVMMCRHSWLAPVCMYVPTHYQCLVSRFQDAVKYSARHRMMPTIKKYLA